MADIIMDRLNQDNLYLGYKKLFWSSRKISII